LKLVGEALIILMISNLTSPVLSRDCGDNVPALLERIEGMKSETDTSELVELLKCLSKPAERWVRDYGSFASEQAMKKIEKETEPYRLRVYKILIPLSSSGDWLVADEAAAALAYYGYTPAGQMLDNYRDGPLKAVLYAIIGYKRSYLWAIDRLLESDRVSHPEDDSIEVRMAYLGLLYHLAEPRSLPFLNGLISSQENPEVRARAELVRERILKSNPELK
jgi:hypothetical protein